MAPHADRAHGLHPASSGNEGAAGTMANGSNGHRARHRDADIYSKHDEETAKPAAVIRKNGAISRPPPLCLENLQRAVYDVSAELGRESKVNTQPNSNSAAEVEGAQCECCGLGEECTPTYISKVRERFCGRWICGLCAEAVNEERQRMGRGTPVEDALRAHMAFCLQFNKLARTNPALYMADAMRQLLRKSSLSQSDGRRSNPGSPRHRHVPSNTKGGIMRSSSCIPALTRDRSSRP